MYQKWSDLYAHLTNFIIVKFYQNSYKFTLLIMILCNNVNNK